MVMEIIISVILVLVGIGFFVICHVCIVGRVFRGRFGNPTMVVRGLFGSRRKMSQDEVQKLPSFDFEENEKGNNHVECVVCLENFKEGDKCRLLPQCNHSFHAKCVDSWLLRTTLCPICRTSAASGGESSNFTGSEIELRQGQAIESDSLREIAIELREGQTVERTRHLSDSGIELRGSQTTPFEGG